MTVGTTPNGQIALAFIKSGVLALGIDVAPHEAVAIALGILRAAAPTLADHVETTGLDVARRMGANVIDKRARR